VPVQNLFKVTKTLADLLSQNITQNIDKNLSGLLTVTAIPPENVENPSNTLSLFLYHVGEDPYYKNAPGPGNDVPNVAKSPMALSLFYILTAHHEIEKNFDAETQQKLMGYALKTFHDFPVVTRRTQVNGVQLLDSDFGSDTIQIILRTVTPEESLAFWKSEDKRTARLSAYYEVRVIMLEPEPPKTVPGIVLNLGSFLLQLGSPNLERSQSVVRFKIPEKNGGAIQEIQATPAQVVVDNSATPPSAHNHFLLLGTNLNAGKSRSLILKNSIWANLSSLAGPPEDIVIDLAVNPEWSLEFRPDRVTVKVASTLRDIKSDGTTLDLPLLPGFYTASERVIVAEKVINNELKRIVQSSPEVSFAVAPRIEGHDPPDGAGNIQINIGPEFDVLDTNFSDDAIQVSVDGEVYSRVDTDPPANVKEFFVANSPSNLIRIRPHFPVVVTQPEAHALGIVINGAQSAPFWIEVNP
jgi:hypothetical protein